MKSFFVTGLMCFASLFGFAQTKLAEFPLAWYLQKAEAFEVGDSIYVTYSDIIGHHDRKQAAWISSDGRVSKFELGPIAAVDLVGVIRQSDNYFFYFLERDKKNKITKLKAQQFNRLTQIKRIVEEEIVFTETIVAIFNEGDELHVICIDQDTGVLSARIISGVKVTASHTINLKIRVEPVKISDIEFYNSSQLSGANTGSTPLKIIKQDRVLYLTEDDSDKTIVIKVELPSYTFQKFILGHPTASEFNTFVSDDVIYKLIADKGVLTLDLYPLQSLEKIASLKSFYKYLQPYQSYERIGFQHKIERKRLFDPTVAPLGVYAPHWAIVAWTGNENNSIRLGIYYNEKRPIGVYMGDLILFALSTVVTQFSEGPGISRYIYFSETKNHFQLSDKETPATMSQAQLADNYEISMNKKAKIMYKGYTTLNGRLIGIYGDEDKKVSFVRF